MRARPSRLARIVIIVACGKLRSERRFQTDGSASRSRHRSRRPSSARIRVVTVALDPYPARSQTTGTSRSTVTDRRRCSSPVSGPVTRILVQPGASVARGTPLAIGVVARFRDRDRRVSQGASERDEPAAHRGLDEQLFKNDAIARRELEQAQTDAAAAVADREAALEQLRALGVDDARSPLRDERAVSALAASFARRSRHASSSGSSTPGQLDAGRRDAALHDRRSVHDVGHGERLRVGPLGKVAHRRSGRGHRPTRARRRSRASSTTSPRSSIRPRKRDVGARGGAEPRRAPQARHVRARRDSLATESQRRCWYLTPRCFATTRTFRSCSSPRRSGYARRRSRARHPCR